ncbi:MAG TPA: Rpn family recombination-promoting nuclease/putative transposase [Treponemataceae bacterium]|nr:Rpn family recombination-promoting nuclease/putative transposase [Treponemataceae bacterium]
MDKTLAQNHPHDTFFRRNFAHKEILREFLDSVLPPELLNAMDKDSLLIEPTNFVDKEHQDHFSDISATIQLSNQKTYVYLLMEHKSYNDPMALLQILRYMQLKWTQEVEEVKGRKVTLTPIIPILFHHGSNKNPPTHFTELFAKNIPEMLKAYQPDFLVALYNLTTTPDEKIDASPVLASTLFALKHSRTSIATFLEACSILVQKHGRDFLENVVFESVMFYILTVSKVNSEELKRNYLDKINSPELKEAFMSTADMLIEQGIEQGNYAKAVETARNMFAEGLDLSMISRITGLSEDALIKIRDDSL